MPLTVLLPKNECSPALQAMLTPLLPAGSVFADPEKGLDTLRGRRLLFAVALDRGGCNEAYYRMLSRLRRNADLLSGCIGGVVVTGEGELYTKDVARDMVFAANQAGCAFLGRPLVEATGSMRNFRVQAQIGGVDEETAFRAAVAELIDRLLTWEKPEPIRRVLALHASQRSTSNTLAFWELVRTNLPPEIAVEEIGLRNGTLDDCSGCPYQMCLHFGERGKCFYGGPIVESVYPGIQWADGLLLLCPNYNDALSANLTAFINRLTALFRTTRFYDKALFAIIVSGYSGSDLIAGQLITALNMNKTFYLPGNFCIMETGNSPGSAMKRDGIGDRIQAFADTILETMRDGESRKER